MVQEKKPVLSFLASNGKMLLMSYD